MRVLYWACLALIAIRVGNLALEIALRPLLPGFTLLPGFVQAGAANLTQLPANTSLADALGRIRARTAVVAGRHDLYFPPADCAAEAALIPGGRLHVLESDLGHRAGNPRQSPAEQAALRRIVDGLWEEAEAGDSAHPEPASGPGAPKS
jgi:pimeloyl-ACP methyl ester carboxylesterase